MKLKPHCNPCKKGLAQSEFITKNFIINVCGNCEYNEKQNKEVRRK